MHSLIHILETMKLGFQRMEMIKMILNHPKESYILLLKQLEPSKKILLKYSYWITPKHLLLWNGRSIHVPMIIQCGLPPQVSSLTYIDNNQSMKNYYFWIFGRLWILYSWYIMSRFSKHYDHIKKCRGKKLWRASGLPGAIWRRKYKDNIKS